MRQCSVEECTYPVFSKGKCKYHMERKALKRGPLVSKKESPSDYTEMREFSLSVWSKRLHRSEISHSPLGNEPLTIFFHHILPKENYKEAKYDQEN